MQYRGDHYNSPLQIFKVILFKMALKNVPCISKFLVCKPLVIFLEQKITAANPPAYPEYMVEN